MGEAELFSGGCYDGRRRSAAAELWRPCWPDVACGEPGRSREFQRQPAAHGNSTGSGVLSLARPTEQKPAKRFEQEAAKVTKSLGSTIDVVVLQA
jgi:hypothetical protein